MQMLTLLQRDRLSHVDPVYGELRIGNVTDSAGTKYFTAGRKFTPNLASEIIVFCGTRIQLLKGTSDKLGKGIGLKGLSTPLAVACVLF